MDEQSRLRQFNLRALLASGLLLGAFLLVQLLVFAATRQSAGSFFDSLAFVANCLIVGPACLLAFWQRRAACVLLILNAILTTASAISSTLRTHRFEPGPSCSAAVAIVLAASLVTIEIRRWPGALAKDR
jgi:hypothetical protein